MKSTRTGVKIITHKHLGGKLKDTKRMPHRDFISKRGGYHGRGKKR